MLSQDHLDRLTTKAIEGQVFHVGWMSKGILASLSSFSLPHFQGFLLKNLGGSCRLNPLEISYDLMYVKRLRYFRSFGMSCVWVDLLLTWDTLSLLKLAWTLLQKVTGTCKSFTSNFL